MKKIDFLITMFFILMINVSAKEELFECRYNVSERNTNILCVIYDNYSHKCYVQENGEATTNSNKEDILNWGKAVGIDFQAKQWVEQNNQCPNYLVAKLDSGVDGYQLHAFQDRNEAFELIKTYKDNLGENRYLAEIESLENTRITHICSYKNYTLTFKDGDLYGTTTSEETIYNGISVELQNTDSCPTSTYYGSCVSGKCTILTKPLEGFQGDFQEAKLCLNEGYDTGLCVEESDGNQNIDDSENEEEEDTPPDYNIEDTSADTICTMPAYRKPMKFIGTIINFLKIIVPIIIIAFGVVDLYKAVTGSKDDEIKKSIKSIIIRVVAGIAIFLLPGIIQFVLNWVNAWSDYKNSWCCCTDCLLNPDCDVNSCNSSSCKIEGTN